MKLGPVLLVAQLLVGHKTVRTACSNEAGACAPGGTATGRAPKQDRSQRSQTKNVLQWGVCQPPYGARPEHKARSSTLGGWAWGWPHPGKTLSLKRTGAFKTLKDELHKHKHKAATAAVQVRWCWSEIFHSGDFTICNSGNKVQSLCGTGLILHKNSS